MEEDDKTLEATLEALHPAEVPPHLERKILAIFDGAGEVALDPVSSKIVPFPLWQRLGTAAAVLVAGVGVFFAVLNNFGPASSPTSKSTPIASAETLQSPKVNSFQPVRAENVFEGVSDSGVYIGENGEPVRELRYQFSDSFFWQNKEDGSEIEVRIPRERRYLLPVPTD